MENDNGRAYRVTIRYFAARQQYEVFEVEAADLREALALTADRFPEGLLDSADLAEVRLAHPPDRPA